MNVPLLFGSYCPDHWSKISIKIDNIVGVKTLPLFWSCFLTSKFEKKIEDLWEVEEPTYHFSLIQIPRSVKRFYIFFQLFFSLIFNFYRSIKLWKKKKNRKRFLVTPNFHVHRYIFFSTSFLYRLFYSRLFEFDFFFGGGRGGGALVIRL